MNALAQLIVRTRKSRRLSQTQAGKELGFTQTKMSRVELGTSKPYEDVNTIAQWLDVSIERVLRLLETPAGVDKDLMTVAEMTQQNVEKIEEVEQFLVEKIHDIHSMLYELLSMASPPSADMIGAAIKMQRENYGHSLQDVSHQTGLPASLIKRMEEGVAGYGANIPDIAAYLEMKTSDIELLLNIETQEYKKMFAERMRKNVEERGKTGANYQQPSIENFRKMVSDVAESMEKSKTQKTEKEVNGNV